MTNVKMGPMFSGTKGHAMQKEFLRVERPPPEGAGSSANDSHAAPWTGVARSSAGSLTAPLTNSLLRSKWSKESLNGYPECNSIMSFGTKKEMLFDTGHLCKKCISYFNVFKREALKQVIDGNASAKDPKFSIRLYDSMKTPTVEAWGDVEGHCGVCFTHFSQLKQEAIRTILTQDRAIWAAPTTANISSTSLDTGSQTLPRTSCRHSNISKSHQSSSNVATNYWVKGRKQLGSLWPLSPCDSVSHKTLQIPLHSEKADEKDCMSSKALCNYNASQPSRASSMSSLIPAGTSAALSFVTRAVQKLNGMVRRGRHCSESGASQHPTNFSSLLQKSPPPVPVNLLQLTNKSKETPGMGKIKVMLRVCSVPVSKPSQSHTFKVDLRKKQITVLDPASHNPQRQATGTAVSPKTFTFDALFGPDSTQAEVCESSLSELLQCVVAGTDGCILSFGQTKVGTYYTMIGHDGCTESLGVLPCAISWLFKLINRKKDKTWANISVSVSAVEVCGENNSIRDLLSGVETGNCKDTYKTDAYLEEDLIYEQQLCNHSVLNAPTPERAAFLLDAALASRSSGMLDSGGTPLHSCHMFFTLHVRQQHIGSSTKSGMKVDQSKLSLIYLGSCVGERDKSNCGICLADLGNTIIAKLNRHKHVPNSGSYLDMLLQDSLNNINCSTTIIAHISTSPQDLTESLCTMQTVSRIRRQKKKIRKSSSSSPGGRSSGNERKVNKSTRLRTFRSTGTLDQETSSPGFFGDPEFHPGSNKSCESVIYMDPFGLLNKEDTNRSREVLPIIPSLLKSKLESKKLSLMKFCEISPPLACRMKQTPKEKAKEESKPTILQDKLESDFECLKCNTFAELQNRLGNIDGTELFGMDNVIKAPQSNQIEKKLISSEDQASSEWASNSIRQGSPTKRDDIIHNTNEIPHAAVKCISDIVQTCSTELDFVRQSDPALSGQSPSTSEHQAEKMDVTSEEKYISLDDPTIKPETRIPPTGKSSLRSTSSSSFSSSFSASLGTPLAVSANVNEDVLNFTMKNQQEMKATITVTVQQPLDLNGHDELVYTVVEEVTINGATENDKAKILSAHDSHSLQTLTHGCQPVRIIGSVGEEQTVNFHRSTSNVQTSETEISVALSDATVNEPVQQKTINTCIDKVSGIIDSKDPPQCATSLEVPLIEDGPKETLDPNCNHSMYIQVSKSRQNCEILTEQNLLCLSKKKDFKDNSCPHGNTEHKNSQSPRETERKQYILKQEIVEGTKDNAPLPSTHTNIPNTKKKNVEKKEGPGIVRSAQLNQWQLLLNENKTEKKSPLEDSRKQFNAKLKALSSRSQTFDLSNSENFLRSTGSFEGICTSTSLKTKLLEDICGIDVGSKGLLERDYMPAQSKSMNLPGFKEGFEEDFVKFQASESLGRVPRFFPMPDVDAEDTTQSSKISKSKTTAVKKCTPSLKSHKMSYDACPKNTSLSPKSTRHSINRSSSLSYNEISKNQSSWSTQSLSRSQVKGGLCPKSSGFVLKGRVELLRSSGDSLSSFSQGGSDLDESEELMATKTYIHTLPSPYNQITAPRESYHCSGHTSDTTSVLSGELPPAMCKTALLYSRGSMVSSGYESVLRDSEATISSSSTHNSISDQSCTLGAANGTRSSKKRTNIGSNLRCSSKDNLQTLNRSFSGPKMHRVDRGVSDSYEIKVYEIDNVDTLQKRGVAGNKGIVHFSAKLKFLEHRQQRIAEVRVKYNALKRELEHAKQHLMVDPAKWTHKFDLWQTFEVDSLEHLEALELVTERLEQHVNLCKAHVLMVTCFDVTTKCRQKLRHLPSVNHKGCIGI
ncbi:kinesin-like protein KIF26B isoform X1 [Xyrauchen texanus]|uniref:kinesin-like protein KIF26B isoform X1 n=2 Tax=Xyrauchen texanus TaxID=154827 RepID=UPI002242B828|nr:kinesin-like protein KIF26B isoform X1 [Xyrauchen texanus]